MTALKQGDGGERYTGRGVGHKLASTGGHGLGAQPLAQPRASALWVTPIPHILHQPFLPLETSFLITYL